MIKNANIILAIEATIALYRKLGRTYQNKGLSRTQLVECFSASFLFLELTDDPFAIQRQKDFLLILIYFTNCFLLIYQKANCSIF
jgi:hypothetical protein